jgi:hypothetical protein
VRKYSSRLRLSAAPALHSKIDNHIFNTGAITKRADIWEVQHHDNCDDSKGVDS